MLTHHRWIRGVILLIAGLWCGSGARAEVVDPYGLAVMDDSPIGYWRLRESGLTAAEDETTHGRDLTYESFDSGDFSFSGPLAIGGTAPSFSGGASVHGSDPANFAFTSGQSFSYEFWMRGVSGPDNVQGLGLLTKGYETNNESLPWYLSRVDNGHTEMFTRDRDEDNFTATGSTPVLDDVWHHVVAVYDAAAAQNHIYVDGALDGQAGGVDPDDYGTNDKPLYIGRHYNRNFTGQIAEVALYDSALGEARVLAHFESSELLPEPTAAALLTLLVLIALRRRPT